MSTTPRNNRRRKTSLLGKSRWAGYAAAGAATALGTYEAAEAGIWYSGVLNGGQGVRMSAWEANSGHVEFGIDLPGNAAVDDLMMFHHKGTMDSVQSGAAVANSMDNHSFEMRLAKVAGTVNGSYYNAFRFAKYAAINDHQTFLGFGTMATGSVASCKFRDPGEGFLGFSFEDNGQTRYGWLRVIMDGGPINGYTIMDYAYAGANEGIEAGQVPEPGSLGLLATGGIGLLLWRRRRANRKSA